MLKRILSCDWGTSSFRLRLVNLADSAVIAGTAEGPGITTAHEEWMQSSLPGNERIAFYKNILLAALKKIDDGSLRGVPLIVSGMASSSIGMKELPYEKIPLEINYDKIKTARVPPSEMFNYEILLVSGLKSDRDVMRGEETMLLGCGINNNEWLAIFPGTHSKHITVKNNILSDIKTYMTGEIFELLAFKSILSKSITKTALGNYPKIFEKGVAEGASGNLLNTAFHIRTSDLFKELTPGENYEYLSGLLIGSELGQISSANTTLVLVSSGDLSRRYHDALRVLGVTNNIQLCDSHKALIKGHCELANHFL